MITTYHNISFGTQTVPEQIPVVQGDTGREIVFILTDFTIPEGATATYYVQKPSGEAVYNSATISENNIIVALTAQSIIEVGENDMQVRVILGEDIVTSFRAILMVRPFLGIGAVESSTEINIFDQAVEDAYERITEEVVWPANFYGTCQTAAATQDKTVTVQGGFILKSGVVVNVMCAFTNSASQITLNVNNTGAKAVYYRGSKVSGDMLVANGMYTFVYANSHWNMAGLNGKLLQLDDTFTVSGKAADSKATGDRFDAVEADVTALQAELPDLTEAIMSAFVVDTATGAIATFPDGADNVPVKSLTVEIEPVQSGSGDPSPTNVRPITGHTQAVVTRTGVNVWDEETVAGYYHGSTGEFVPQANTMGSKNPIPAKQNTTYYLKSGTYNINVNCYDADMNFISQLYHKQNATFTTPSNCCYIHISNDYNSGVTYNHDISINYPATDTAYHAYQGETYTIDLDGTRYGGTLDVGTGVLTVDRALYTLTGSESWSAWDTHAYYSACLPSNAFDTNNTVNCISSMLKEETTDAIYAGASGVGARTSRLYISASEYANIGTYTGMQVCYKLATPLTVQLTAQEVKTLLGQNNIFCDVGNVTCQYRADTKLYIEKILNA